MKKTMATHSSVPAWRIPGTGKPGELPSMGSHRVGHDWSDLAAAAYPISWHLSLRMCLKASVPEFSWNLCFLLQVCHANPSERARFIRCIYNLLQSSSPAVKYEAAGTLVTLSSAPTAIKVLSFFVCLCAS